jgi:DNA polymerase delta subunit 2
MLTALDRKLATYQNLSEKYKIIQKVYTQQYAGLYFSRLNAQRPKILETVNSQWGDSASRYAERLIAIKENEVCHFVGTVFVDMTLKPSVLDAISREAWIQAPPPRDKYCSPDDEFILEDESGRVTIVGDILKSQMIVTGLQFLY